MRVRTRLLTTLVGSVTVLSVSCGDSPSGPAPAVQLNLSAPSEIEPGEVVQLRLLVGRGERAVNDVTQRASWHSSAPGVVELSSTGVATGKDRGESTISVSFENRTATQRVYVLPRGTFSVSGVVQESNTPVEGVTLTVLSGASAGLTTVSRTDGRYALYGLSGQVRLRLSRNGFVSAEQELDVTGHLQHDFTMTADGPPRNFNGRYTLTIVATGCPAGFPQAATRRTYAADVTQHNQSLQVILKDSAFLIHDDRWRGRSGDHFRGWVEGASVTLWIGTEFDFYYYYYSTPGSYGIAEQVGDLAVLIRGTVQGSGTTGRIDGRLWGSIDIGGTTSQPFEPITAQCSSNLRVEMVRN